MTHLSRRQFLVAGAALGAAALAVRPARAVDYGFRMGAQSYSFRHFDLAGAVARLKELGLNELEVFSGHLPPDPDNPDLDDVIAMLEAEGVKVPCFGVEGFGADEDANRRKFEFGKRIGLEVLTANPAPESFDNLEELTQEYGIAIAIHNHGPGARYDKVADTLEAVEGRNPLIGACVDTGHVLRSQEQPHEVIRALGRRVLSLHLKDWEVGGPEKALGEGDMDLVEVARALRAVNFTGPVMLEYELDPEDPVPGMRRGLENWRRAVEEA